MPKLKLSLLPVLLLLAMLAACERQPHTSLSVEGLQERLEKGMPLVDIRRPDEWKKTGVIEGSHLITVFDEHNRVIQASFKQILEVAGSKDKPVILIDETGRRSSVAAKAMMEQLGFAEVYSVASGFIGWSVNHMPVVPLPQ